MSDDTEQDNTFSFSLKVTLDRGDYFRRACPTCGRSFKVKVDPNDLAFLLQPTFRQMGLEIGVDPNAEKEEQSSLYCPYCGQYTLASEMLTPLLIRYLHRFVHREYILPKIHRMFSGLEDSIGSRRSRSRGFFSVDITFEASDLTLPPRPISGPEPIDMVPVQLLCCRKFIKVLDGWPDTISCPFCGAEAVLH